MPVTAPLLGVGSSGGNESSGRQDRDMGSQHPSACPQALQGLGLGGLGGLQGASRETRDTPCTGSVSTRVMPL